MRVEIKILNKEFYTTTEHNYTHRACNTEKELYRYTLPSYLTPGSAAMDLVCTEDVVLYPGEVVSIKTGLAIWIDSHHTSDGHFGALWPNDRGYRNDINVAGLIMPRSGLGTKGLVMANTIGLIDQDYQGQLIVQAWNRNESEELSILMEDNNCSYEEAQNLRTDKIELKAGDRFAQLAFVPIIKVQWEVVDDFSDNTIRGSGGFGSSGV